MYQLQLHKTLNQEKWSLFSTDRQLLMIANEINRLSNGLRAGQPLTELHSCIERAFELFDLTIGIQQASLQRELLRLREFFAELYLADETQLKQASDSIELAFRTLLFMHPTSALLV